MLKPLFFILVLISSGLLFGQQMNITLTHALFVCPDGSVKVSGQNWYGQLGLGDKNTKKLPEVNPYLSGIKAASAGKYYFSLFLKEDSTVWACGENTEVGQLGIGNTINQSKPVQVKNIDKIVAISAGGYHSLFLKSDGTAWACGANNHGQLGTGNGQSQNSPAQVIGLTDIIAISAGDKYSLFLKKDGTVWACGNNSFGGQLGIGNTQDQYTAVQVTGLTDVKAISAGEGHSLFLKKDGSVWACGRNGYGQLGTGNNKSSYTPVRVTNLSDIVGIDAGGGVSLFIKNDGTAWACGRNYDGELGIGELNYSKSIPTQVQGVADIIEVASNDSKSFFLQSDGTIWATGRFAGSLFGVGLKDKEITPVAVGILCPIPVQPTVDMSHFPTSVCLGSNLDVTPSISGSNPKFTVVVDNTIQINNPKAITKNSHSVFVLNDNGAVARFALDGSLISNYPFLSISGIQAFAADDSSNLYLFNGDGKIYKCDSTGLLVNTQSVFWQSSIAAQLVLTTPPYPNLFPENLFLVDPIKTSGSLLTGINTYENDPFNNSNIFPATNFPEPFATSMSIDNFYPNKRAMLADPTNSTLHSRVLYPDQGANTDYKEDYLIDPALTAGMAFDFISADTIYPFFTVSSGSTGILGTGANFRNADGSILSYLDTSITSLINPSQPVGMILTPLGSSFQLWVADRGQGRILRAFPSSYQITPELPEGLRYNPNTGEVTGTPVAASAPQTYQVILTTPYGVDTAQFIFGVNAPSGLKNAAGTGSSNGQQNDGLTVKYYDANNCEKLIDIADSLGGTAPGYTRVSQTVYPVVSVIANDQLIRRATQIEAENIDTLQVNVTFYYTYDDIQLYKQTTGSSISNDTTAGTMQMAVLQMHDLPNGGREPIIHSPITAKWVSAEQNWKAVVPVTKFSEFYGGDTSTIQNFNCTNDTALSLTVNESFYVWNFDSLFTSGQYIDTLVNTSGCDSAVTLDLTLKPNGVHESDLASGVHVYPNPSNGVFTIRFDENESDLKSIRITNLLGKEIYTTELRSSSSIDLSDQSNGVYFISIQTGTNRPVVFRVIKW